jgi:hypothetical protein
MFSSNLDQDKYWVLRCFHPFLQTNSWIMTLLGYAHFLLNAWLISPWSNPQWKQEKLSATSWNNFILSLSSDLGFSDKRFLR